MSFTLEEEIFTRDSLDMYLNVTIPPGWSLAEPIVQVTSLDDVLRDYKMERDAFQRDSLNYYHGTRKNRSIAIYLRFKQRLPSYRLRCIIDLRDSTNTLYAVDEYLDVGWSEYSLRPPPSDRK